MTAIAGKSEVVRYISAEPKAWVKRGMLLRVVQRTSSGKIRVTAAGVKPGGALQYIDPDDVEPVGTFENNAIFGGAAIVQPDPVEKVEAEPAPVDAPAPDPAGAPEPASNVDLRQIVRVEVERVVRAMVAEIARDEVARLLGGRP